MDGLKSWDGALGGILRRMWRKGPGVWVSLGGVGSLGISPKAGQSGEVESVGRPRAWRGLTLQRPGSLCPGGEAANTSGLVGEGIVEPLCQNLREGSG